MSAEAYQIPTGKEPSVQPNKIKTGIIKYKCATEEKTDEV